MIKTKALGAALLIAASYASAATWITVDTQPDGSTTQYDKSSLVRSGPLVKVWQQRIYSPPRVVTPGDPGPTAKTKTHWTMNCVERTRGLKSGVIFAPDGSVLYQFSSPEAPLSDVVPESIDEAVMNAVCGGR